MHGLTAGRLEAMNPVATTEMSFKPLDSQLIGNIASDTKQVRAATDEICGVKNRLSFVCNKLDLFARSWNSIGCVKQIVRQGWLGSRSPTCTSSKVFDEEFFICEALPATLGDEWYNCD